MSRGRLWFGVFFVLLTGVTAIAQQITGNIRGVVTDPSGAIVRDATVTAKQNETGLTRSSTTDRNGAYLLVELPVGHYQVEVQAKDFQKYVQQGISLNVNEVVAVDVKLAIGAGSEQILVQADAQLIQGTVTSLGKTVEEREVVDLPLDGRNFTQLGVLQPGVVPLTPGLAEAGGSLREGQAYAVNGQRPESNNFLIDGANNFNGVDGGFVLKPPVDAISEFRILTHNAPAEFGDSLGSTTNIITRSGSNSIHGALWEFLRNDAFDATNHFAKTTEPLKQNQLGASVGGPIRKNKTFFFGYYEGFRNRQGETIPSTVPSLLQRRGDFSEMCVNGFDTTGPFAGLCKDRQPPHNPGDPIDPNDPTSQPVHQLFNIFFNAAVPYNNLLNQIPELHPQAVKLLSLFPEPNVGTNIFNSTETLRENSDQFGIRLDHYLSPKDTLNFHYFFSDGDRVDPLSTSGASVPGFPVGEDHRAQNFVVQATHTFTPAMVGVFRFSFLRNKFLFDQHVNHTSPASLGFGYDPSLPAAEGPPFIQVNGYTTVGDPITGPRNSYENAFDYSGSVSWVRGQHELKFGGGYQRLQVNALQGIATTVSLYSRLSRSQIHLPAFFSGNRSSSCRAAAIFRVAFAAMP